MRIFLAGIFTLWAAAAPASECAGTNLFHTMPPDQRAEIDAAVAGVPYHQGLLWRASKDGQTMILVGTYHFDDPRHDETLARLDPLIADAAALFVEAGPDEERKLTKALAADPALMVDPTGPTLPERLDDSDWALLSAAMAERGTPAVVTSRLRPWYVAMMLGVSPCMMRQLALDGAIGLDRRLAGRAEALEVPLSVVLREVSDRIALVEGVLPEEFMAQATGAREVSDLTVPIGFVQDFNEQLEKDLLSGRI